MLGITEMQKSVTDLEAERLKLWEESTALWNEEWELAYDDPGREAFRVKREAIDQRMDEIQTELNKLRKAIAHARKFYRRPDQGLAGLMSRALGPLPEGTKVIHPTKKNLDKVRSYRLPAFGLVLVAITSLILLTTFVPWMRTSPATLITGLMTDWLGVGFGSIASFVLVILLLVFLGRTTNYNRYRGKFWDMAAMFEEQWFRTGAENWTTRQRITSNVMFGLVHVLNVIYPIASLLVVGLVGAVFMAVYLRAFKQTGSTKLATLASAKLHATYNRFAILYMLAAFALIIIYSTTSTLIS